MRAFKYIVCVCLAAAMVAGCGAAQSTAPSQDNRNSGTTARNANNGGENTPPGNGSTENNSNGGRSLPAQKNVEYALEGMTETHRATLFKSSQGYYIYVITDRYGASGEEPGKDIVMLNANGNSTMRIEMLPKTADLNALAANARQEVEAVGKPAEDITRSFSDSFFQQHTVSALHAAGNTTLRVILIMKIQDVPFKFTISVPAETESVAPYYTMIKTVGVLNADKS